MSSPSTSPLKSDITISASKFAPESISEDSIKRNQQFLDNPEIGLSGFPSIQLPSGHSISLPSREASRNIPCRLFYPKDNSDKAFCKGVILHLHGGGWQFCSEKDQDVLLKKYADVSDCVVISVGYRLAPEFPFPAGPEDCFDVAEYLVDRGEERFGGPLRFVGGESAGGHLSLLTTFHLLRHRPNFRFLGLLLHFGAYDLASPFTTIIHPIVNYTNVERLLGAFLPGKTTKDLQDPSISPYYEDLRKWRGKLPSALFTVGTADILFEDNVLMGTKWLIFGGEAVVKVYPGAVHGFLLETDPVALEGMEDTLSYMREKMSTVV